MKTNVLIVYHNAFGKHLGKLISGPTIETDYTSNLKEALEKVNNFDIVICDIDFPGLKNKNILEENEDIERFSDRYYIAFNFIRKLSKKCILCAGFPSREIEEKLKKMGIESRVKYLITPFNARFLSEEITDFMSEE